MTMDTKTDSENYELFSREFIYNKNLTVEEKGYLAMIQQYMIRDDGKSGIIAMSDSDLSNLTHIGERSIQRYNRSLKKKGYLTLVNLPNNNENFRKLKCFDLAAYGQAVAFVSHTKQSEF